MTHFLYGVFFIAEVYMRCVRWSFPLNCEFRHGLTIKKAPIVIWILFLLFLYSFTGVLQCSREMHVCKALFALKITQKPQIKFKQSTYIESKQKNLLKSPGLHLKDYQKITTKSSPDNFYLIGEPYLIQHFQLISKTLQN